MQNAQRERFGKVVDVLKAWTQVLQAPNGDIADDVDQQVIGLDVDEFELKLGQSRVQDDSAEELVTRKEVGALIG